MIVVENTCLFLQKKLIFANSILIIKKTVLKITLKLYLEFRGPKNV